MPRKDMHLQYVVYRDTEKATVEMTLPNVTKYKFLKKFLKVDYNHGKNSTIISRRALTKADIIEQND